MIDCLAFDGVVVYYDRMFSRLMYRFLTLICSIISNTPRLSLVYSS